MARLRIAIANKKFADKAGPVDFDFYSGERFCPVSLYRRLPALTRGIVIVRKSVRVCERVERPVYRDDETTTLSLGYQRFVLADIRKLSPSSQNKRKAIPLIAPKRSVQEASP